MNITYKQATNQDVEKIYELSKALIEQYEDIASIDYERVLKWVKNKIENNVSNYKTVWMNEVKVGYFYLHEEAEQLELDDFYIVEAYQNQGIGSYILKECIAISEQQHRSIFLYVFSKNIGAIKLYKKFGFEITEKIKDTRYMMTRK